MSIRSPRGLLKTQQSPLWTLGRAIILAASTVFVFTATLCVLVLVAAD